ncbi:MAG TPA: CocE/NonD family hydrolase [Gaiellales bacterium]
MLVERDVGITVRDGVRLSADVYRPNRPGRFPALLEHIPYRKDDLRAPQDRGQNVTLVEAGFACVRLDVRGTGSSEGVAEDEYTEAEQRDGVEAVAWIAEQEWCTGRVGAWGKSYGGFSCIQLAARNPPALAAIAPVYATDDRFTADMHYDGGAVCAFELTNYPIRMIAMNALPPGSASDEPRWIDRIERTPPWVLRWLREQRDGPFWRNGSLRPEYDRIRCPVFIVSGWRDGYRTAGLRMAQRLEGTWQLLAGPWAHYAPDRGVPAPRHPFMAELIRFFQTHLADGAATARPRSVFFIGEFDSTAAPHAEVSGSWHGSDAWPGRCSETVLTLGAAGVAPASATVGLATGNWCPPPPEHGQFADQRADEARSLCVTSAALAAPVEVLGAPVVRFGIDHPGPRAIVSVKLNDVAPSGESAPVTRGAVVVDCDGPAMVELPLMATGWRFRPGHRIRVAVAANDWPCLWPLPGHHDLAVTTAVELALPGLPADAAPYAAEDDIVPVTAPEAVGHDRPSTWRITTDVITGRCGVDASDHSAFELPEDGMLCEEAHRYHTSALDDDPLSARAEGRTRLRVRTSEHDVEARARGRFSATATEFVVDLELDVRRDGVRLHRRRWRERIPRDGT